MGRDCFIVWRYDEEIAIEGVFETQDDAEYYQQQRAEFVEHMAMPPSFHVTVLEGGLYEQNSLP